MNFWGITGTNGKTTTTWIFAEFLNATPGRKCGYVTTVEVNTGSRQFYTGYTTPPLAQLKEIFAEMEANGCTDCVMEVSSHAIHQHRTGDTVFSDSMDLRQMKQNRADEEKAFRICEDRIARHGLDMKLVEVEYNLDRSKILFYFTADGRVDFRELVKDLAGVFHTRIELRQIGVRDESKMLGGIGICGQPFCCSRFLKDFQPVSIKMAKEQGLSLNPVKISGTCGRLMCCLKYEQEA